MQDIALLSLMFIIFTVCHFQRDRMCLLTSQTKLVYFLQLHNAGIQIVLQETPLIYTPH